jgi:site-specific recombinase XerD
LLSELSVKFLQDFEHYLKTVRNCNHNTTAKYLKNLKKVINTAIVNQWIEKNPFLGYKITIKQTIKDYLVEEELKRIESKTFPMERLEAIRKIFLFQCYTGLAYIDVKGLTMDNIVSSKGNHWLVIESGYSTELDHFIPQQIDH